MTKSPLRRIAALVLSCAGFAGAQAATITIVKQNAPGIGFNDPTPVTPVGGNRAPRSASNACSPRHATSRPPVRSAWWWPTMPRASRPA